MKGFDEYMKEFDRIMEKKYVIPKSKWTPQDEAVYLPKDPFRIPLKEAEELRFKALKYSFSHHYKNNTFYNKLCKERGVKPEDIKKPSDLVKIPLVPDKFFKDYPDDGRSFAVWLSNIYTGKLPEIYIKKRNPKTEDVIDDFNTSGLTVTLSSGTSGKHTFIPRDADTIRRASYSIAKNLVSMLYPFWEYNMVMYKQTDPSGTNLWVGKAGAVFTELAREVRIGTKIKITPKMVRLSMGGARSFAERMEGKIIRSIAKRHREKMVDDFINLLEEMEKKDVKLGLIVQPSFMNMIMKILEQRSLKFNFSKNGAMLTGGGWKISESERIPHEGYREKVGEFLSIPDERILDLYGMVECNTGMIQCSEGHYLHIPYAQIYPMVLDENLEPKGYGEVGRFAFLEATASSYPSFITTGDEVKLLEHCPVCDRPGPVLEPEVKRAKGEEVRGCAEEMRRLFSISED
ncbi:MAG TPA: hypothetical protein ENG24_02995 [Thermoplasmatales archaeon]|nr:hypothetical protein [Thermoplasmatales archaeon]